MWNLWSREPKSLSQRARSPPAIIPMLCGQAIQLFPRPIGRWCTVHIWWALIRGCNLCNSEKPKYFFSYNFLRVFSSLGEGYLHVSITWFILYCTSLCEQVLYLLLFKKKRHVDLLLCYQVQFVSKWWCDTNLDIYSLINGFVCSKVKVQKNELSYMLPCKLDVCRWMESWWMVDGVNIIASLT